MNPVIIGVKTNHPDARTFLAQLLKDFSEILKIKKVSSLYRMKQQEGVCLAFSAEASMPARELLEHLHKREENYRAQVLRRSIKLNLFLYGAQTQMTAELTLPHPDLHEMPEYIIPAAEVEPEVLHPVIGQTLLDLSRRHAKKNWGEFISQGQELLDF